MYMKHFAFQNLPNFGSSHIVNETVIVKFLSLFWSLNFFTENTEKTTKMRPVFHTVSIIPNQNVI